MALSLLSWSFCSTVPIVVLRSLVYSGCYKWATQLLWALTEASYFGSSRSLLFIGRVPLPLSHLGVSSAPRSIAATHATRFSWWPACRPSVGYSKTSSSGLDAFCSEAVVVCAARPQVHFLRLRFLASPC